MKSISLLVLSLACNLYSLHAKEFLSPDGKRCVIFENGECNITSKTDGHILSEVDGDSDISNIYAIWSLSSDKVLIVVTHHHWDELLVFLVRETSIEKGAFQAPDGFPLLKKEKHQSFAEYRKLSKNISLGTWSNNNAIHITEVIGLTPRNTSNAIFDLTVEYDLLFKNKTISVEAPKAALLKQR